MPRAVILKQAPSRIHHRVTREEYEASPAGHRQVVFHRPDCRRYEPLRVIRLAEPRLYVQLRLPPVIERTGDLHLRAIVQAEPAADVLEPVLAPAGGGKSGAGQDNRADLIKKQLPHNRGHIDRR